MSEPVDLTVQILREIRDEIAANRRESKEGLAGLRSGLDDLRSEVRVTNERVERVEHTLLDLAEQQRFVVRHLKTLSERDRRLEDEVTEIRGRLEIVEKKLAAG